MLLPCFRLSGQKYARRNLSPRRILTIALPTTTATWAHVRRTAVRLMLKSFHLVVSGRSFGQTARKRSTEGIGSIPGNVWVRPACQEHFE